MLNLVGEVQVGLLAVLLISGSAAKLWHTSGTGAPGHGTGPTAMFPVRLRRPAATALCATEFALGAGLLLTAGSAGAGGPAVIVRGATFVLFCTAVGALHELRGHRPDAGCGCFGELSGTPIGLRTIARPGLLCASAVATLGLPPLRMPSSPTEAELWLAVLAFELALTAFLSPELGEIMVRLGYSEPCELRRMPVGRTMSALHASSQWRRYAGQVSAGMPSDVWREGCWRFVVYPGYARGRPVDIVFAVYLQSRRPAVRAAVLDADTDEVLGPAGTRESAVL